MLVYIKDVVDKFKNPVADVYLVRGGCYRNCDILVENDPNTRMVCFFSKGVIYSFPIKEIARIEVYDHED